MGVRSEARKVMVVGKNSNRLPSKTAENEGGRQKITPATITARFLGKGEGFAQSLTLLCTSLGVREQSKVRCKMRELVSARPEASPDRLP